MTLAKAVAIDPSMDTEVFPQEKNSTTLIHHFLVRRVQRQ